MPIIPLPNLDRVTYLKKVANQLRVKHGETPIALAAPLAAEPTVQKVELEEEGPDLPTTSNTKAEILDWFDAQGVDDELTEGLTKAELVELAEEITSEG